MSRSVVVTLGAHLSLCQTGTERCAALSAMAAADTTVVVWGTNEHGALCLPAKQAVSEARRVLALRSDFSEPSISALQL